MAAGIAGALTGGESIPEEWIKQVDYATTQNPYTNSKRTLRENSDLIYNAYMSRLGKHKRVIKPLRNIDWGALNTGNINIKDIARLAGVGVATVSRVINNTGEVKEAIRNGFRKLLRNIITFRIIVPGI